MIEIMFGPADNNERKSDGMQEHQLTEEEAVRMFLDILSDLAKMAEVETKEETKKQEIRQRDSKFNAQVMDLDTLIPDTKKRKVSNRDCIVLGTPGTGIHFHPKQNDTEWIPCPMRKTTAKMLEYKATKLSAITGISIDECVDYIINHGLMNVL